MQLLIYQAPLSAVMLIPLIFIFDDYTALFAFKYSFGAVVRALLCVVALSVCMVDARVLRGGAVACGSLLLLFSCASQHRPSIR